jgi:hypothetical protein
LVKKKAAEARAVETEASGKAEGLAAALSTDPALHVDLRSPPKASD